MFKLLSEIHTKARKIVNTSGETITMHDFDLDKSNKLSDMGVKTIDVAGSMIPEDKQAFELIQKNVVNYKRMLKTQGKDAEANAIPDHILTPPEFVFGCHAYTFRKFPDNIEDITHTLGAMSAIKGRNDYYKMDDENLKLFTKEAANRLADNITKLLTKEHTKIRRKNVKSAMANLAVTSNFYWLNQFKPDSVHFPANTVLAPLGSSSGLVGMFTNNLSDSTNTPILKNAFIKSNNPKVSQYTWTQKGTELRIGTDFLSNVMNGDFGKGKVSNSITEIKTFLTEYLKLPNLQKTDTDSVRTAIKNLDTAQKHTILSTFGNDARFPQRTPKRFNTTQKQIEGFYSQLLKDLRIALTVDFDEYTSIINELIAEKLMIKNSPGQTAAEKQAQKDRVKEIDNDILAYKEQLNSIPLPDLSTSGDVNKATYDQLSKTLRRVRKFLKDIDLTSSDLDNKTRLTQVMNLIKQDATDEEGRKLSKELQDLYLLAKGKVFKYSGAKASVGGDFNKGFSRFQLANLKVAKQLNGKHVIITDDNISSGGTVRDAIVSLYANGIVPLSILVVAPHLLDNTAAVNLTGLPEDEWKAQRRAAGDLVTTHDANYRKRVIQTIRDEVTLTDGNNKAVETLADLAIGIIRGDHPFTHIVDAQDILVNPFMYDNYIDTVVELGKASDAYGNWVRSNSLQIGKAKHQAAEEIRTFAPKSQSIADLNANKPSKREIPKHDQLKSAATAAKTAVTLSDRIDAIARKIDSLKTANPKDPTIPRYEVTLEYLKKQKMQADGGYVGADLDSIRSEIEKLILAGRNYQAQQKINEYSGIMHKRAKQYRFR